MDTENLYFSLQMFSVHTFEICNSRNGFCHLITLIVNLLNIEWSFLIDSIIFIELLPFIIMMNKSWNSLFALIFNLIQCTI